MGYINIAVKKLPGTVANKIKENTERMPKPNYFDNSNSKLKLYKIQNVTVIENPKLENEEDFSEELRPLRKLIHLVVILVYKVYSFFFLFVCK